MPIGSLVQNRKVQCYVNLLENKAYAYKDGKPEEVPVPDMGQLEDLKTAMVEAVAETSEELMEKYFSGEEFTQDELITGLAMRRRPRRNRAGVLRLGLYA